MNARGQVLTRLTCSQLPATQRMPEAFPGIAFGFETAGSYGVLDQVPPRNLVTP